MIGDMEFSAKLAQLIRESGRTQEAIASRTGIPQPAISQMVNGKRRPRVEQALALARALGVSLDYLADDSADAAEPAPVRLTEDERKILAMAREVGFIRAYALLSGAMPKELPAAAVIGTPSEPATGRPLTRDRRAKMRG